MKVSFIGGGNRRKPQTCIKSLANSITKCRIEYTSPWAGFELPTLVVICTDCIGSCTYNYHMITTTMAPCIGSCTYNYHMITTTMTPFTTDNYHMITTTMTPFTTDNYHMITTTMTPFTTDNYHMITTTMTPFTIWPVQKTGYLNQSARRS